MEFQNLAEDLQDELLAHAKWLLEFGPQLGRPTVDTLKGSKHANMKELRFRWKRTVWRASIPRGRPFCWRWRQKRDRPEAVLQTIDRNGG